MTHKLRTGLAFRESSSSMQRLLLWEREGERERESVVLYCCYCRCLRPGCLPSSNQCSLESMELQIWFLFVSTSARLRDGNRTEFWFQFWLLNDCINYYYYFFFTFQRWWLLNKTILFLFTYFNVFILVGVASLTSLECTSSWVDMTKVKICGLKLKNKLKRLKIKM